MRASLSFLSLLPVDVMAQTTFNIGIRNTAYVEAWKFNRSETHTCTLLFYTSMLMAV